MKQDLNSPGDLLASFLSPTGRTPELIILTGGRGAGKTTWCLELARQAVLAGVLPDGFVSPAVFEGGEKIGIDLVRLPEGERRRLAMLRQEDDPGDDPLTRRWRFDAAVLAWADGFLGELAGGDLLILDELGPLEFGGNQGLLSGLDLIDSRRYRLNVVVIRPELVDAARGRWAWGEVLAAGKTFSRG